MTDSAIGVAHKRVDGRLKVSGRARYAADHPLTGMLFAYGVFSTIASGRVAAIHTETALRMPGVVTILDHRNFSRVHRTPNTPMNLAQILTLGMVDEHRLPFEDDLVYYPGQFVALVVADSFEHARAAAQRVEVDYAEARPVKSLAEALKTGGSQKAPRGHERGDVHAGIEAGMHTITQTYTTPVEVHNPMEMHTTTAVWQSGRLIVYESSQGVVNHRNVLANVFDLAPDQIDVRAPFIGSGFGGKLWPWPHSVAACGASKITGRPVQLVLPRAQMFTTVGHRPETLQHVRLATDRDGKLTAISHVSYNSTSTIDRYTETCGGMTKSLYSCPNVLISHNTSAVNRGTPTSMRAPGAAPGLFALESAIDEMAEVIGMDPLTFRQLNLSERDESSGLPWSSNHLAEAMKKAAAQFGWSRRNPDVGSMQDGDEIIGYGVGACNWEAFRLTTDARVTLRSDGTALAQCGLQDIGGGTYTVVAQTVSEITGLPLESIEVELGSSAFPAGPVSGGSWATASAMSAIAGATREAISKVKSYAVAPGAPFAGAKVDDIAAGNGSLSLNGRHVGYADILQSQKLARAEGFFRSLGADTSKFSFRSFGVHFVEVRWDPGISRLRVARVVTAVDVGKVINPLTARNQVEGGVVMGLSMALFENAEFDGRNGLPLNNNYAEYVVSVHADQPAIEVILLDYPDFHLGEFGARGIGEIGITGVAAATANAVYHATGKRIRNLPITKEKLMEGIPPVSV
jgi:xanthine dehydrogenase YagR molybdenum-binding subunit